MRNVQLTGIGGRIILKRILKNRVR